MYFEAMMWPRSSNDDIIEALQHRNHWKALHTQIDPVLLMTCEVTLHHESLASEHV